MTPVLPAILALAAVDAVNPTSIVGAIYLAGSRQTARLRLFVTGVFCTYLSIGLALMLGPAAMLRSALGRTPDAFGAIVEVAVGGLLLGMGIRASRHRRLPRPRSVPAAAASGRSGLLLGFLATLADLPTAAPLFLAVALLAGLGRLAQLTDLGLYNAVYVSPLLMIAVVHGRSIRPGGPTRTWRRRWVEGVPRVIALCVAGVIVSGQGVAALV